MCIKRKALILISTLGGFAAALTALFLMERSTCMNLPLISEKELEQYTEVTSLELSEITFEDEKAAIDWVNQRIFISQPETAIQKNRLLGGIGTKNPQYSLAILKTEELKNMDQAVREGTPLILIVRCGAEYQRVKLTVTSLPVIYLGLQETYEDEEGNIILNGTFTMWNSAAPGQEQYKISKSEAIWHIRGNSSKSFSKNPWKLNLRQNGKNKNLELLGMGSDDDWILNPMNMDDTKIKEKLAQSLWNQLARETEDDYPMSQGEYIELIINGAYQGIYLMQRRIDMKYLNLNKTEDILFKGKNIWNTKSGYPSDEENVFTVKDGYEIISSPIPEDETYIEFEKTLECKANQVNLNNFSDVNLLVQFLSGGDNTGYKNMFYAMKKEGEEYCLHWIPWDTDLSWGVTWGYDYERSMSEMTERRELSFFCEHFPELREQIAQRWGKLRKTIYSEENIFSNYAEITDILDGSGALLRDFEKWGNLHEGEDHREHLESFLEERLQLLDVYYAALE